MMEASVMQQRKLLTGQFGRAKKLLLLIVIKYPCPA
jgi:hypothetical protein